MMPAKSHSALVEGFRRTARAMAALPQESDLNFVFPSAMQGFHGQVLPVATGGDVCRVLNRSSDGRPSAVQISGR